MKSTPEITQTVFARTIEQLNRAVFGKTEVLTDVLAGVFAGSHILFEDVPGVAKTHLVKSLARVLGLRFQRIQCTPDLLPSDITGVSIFSPKTTEFEFRPGPIFANLILADELNRATPRTQSALLECMAERQVTVDGLTRKLPSPFMVFATQNPIEQEGTFPLPEAQLDRFAMRLSIGYPGALEEVQVLRITDQNSPAIDLPIVSGPEEICACVSSVESVFVHPEVQTYIVRLVQGTRNHPDILLGCGPRASIDLFRLSRAFAAINGQSHVDPEAVRHLAVKVMEHRLIPKPEARIRGRTAGKALAEILEKTPLPKVTR